MRLLLLAEGDAERWDSWSGSTKSVVDHLRRAGHDVVTADVDLYGRARWLAAARNFSPNRKRWEVRYPLPDPAYRARSRRAARAITAHSGRLDCVLQIGATFEPLARANLPYAVFCDSNIQMSLEGSAYGVSDATWLPPDEFDAIRHRETRLYRDACVVFTISDYLRRSFVEVSRSIRNSPLRTIEISPPLNDRGGKWKRESKVKWPPVSVSAPGVVWLGSLNKNRPEQWARLVAAYREADMFCLPSLFEPFGIVLLEAMFFGLPCER